MKMKKISIFFTIMMCMILGITIILFHKTIVNKWSVVDYRERLEKVISALEDNENTADTQTRYGCTIIFRNDAMYESLLMSAINKDSVILDYEKDGRLLAKVIFPGNGGYYNEIRHTMMLTIILMIVGVLISGYVILAILYVQYERPFHKLRSFAQNIARGNLDIPLQMEKGNYFGVFTESFDLMRTELSAARESAYQANVSKKELIAELSHDMKTPIATIIASCEVMDTSLANGRNTDPAYYRNKLSVIIKKADMMNQLIDNMFHATLEELQTLKVNATEQPSVIIRQILHEQQDYIEICLENEIPEMLICIDVLRFGQVIDNIVNNANKYAGTGISVAYTEKENGLLLTISDKGPGVEEEELALVTQKFYKGKNGKHQNGAGLGLYLSDYFMRQMGGSFNCYNNEGFVIELFLHKA